MVYLFIALIVLGAGHYIYETILLPTYRQQARDELFVLRDKLRAELIKEKHSVDKDTLQAFSMIDSIINKSLNRLHLLTIPNMIKFELMKDKSSEIQDEIERENGLLNRCSDDVVKEVNEQMNVVLMKVLVVNSMGLVIYLMPFILVARIVSSLCDKMKTDAKRFVSIVVGAPDDKAARFLIEA